MTFRALDRGSGKMPSLGKSLTVAAVTVLGGLSLSGCATTEYVDEQIAAVNARISAVEAQVQEVNSTAQGAAAAAQAAGAEAQTANQRLDQLTGRVDSIEQRMAQRRPRN